MRDRNFISNRVRLKKHWEKKLKHTGMTLWEWRRSQAKGAIQKHIARTLDKSWRKKYKAAKPTKRNDKDERRDQR